ncbi:hypothetical protein ACFQ4C_18045 [Larkinella insperata]|uniref:Uncharacterized protein n=1 Tax=Larkinella insperata TaxID=332158 RepID=A0ABW3Q8Q2_9BACT|nr:hypothetical protein [Larkinella insperata]
MNPIHLNDTGSVAYLPTVHAVVNLPGVGTAGPNGQAPVALGASPTEPVRRRELQPGDDHIAYWGDGNDFPQQIIKLASKNTIIPTTLSKKAALWIGGGVYASADEEDETPVKDPEIRRFLNDITTKRYLLETALDINWFANSFPEFILSKNREKVVQLHSNEAAYCRFGRMNEQTGEIDKLYLNANWEGASAADPQTIVIPAINPYSWDRVEKVRKGKAYKYSYPLSFPSPGRSYYQLANWDSARSSGWLEVLDAIPQFKKFSMQNQMQIKYHIEVPSDYWPQVYGDRWEQGSIEARTAIRDEFLKALMDKLSNVQNANKGILTETWIDRGSKNEVGIKINVLDDKHKEGKYNEDYTEGLANLYYALDFDPTLGGFAGMGPRSGGSDKREAFWIFISGCKPWRDRILEPLEFTAQYNGWKKKYPELTFRFRDTFLTTLDTGKSTATSNTATTATGESKPPKKTDEAADK